MSTDAPPPIRRRTITATDAVGPVRRKGRLVIDRECGPRARSGQKIRETRPANLRKPICTCSARPVAYAWTPGDSRAVVADGASARAAERADALAFGRWVRHHDVTSTTDSDQPEEVRALPGLAVLDSPAGATMIYEPRPRPLSEALAAMPDLRNRLNRSRAGRNWSPLPDVHHPRHRHARGALAMPNSRGRRGRTGHNLTGTIARSRLLLPARAASVQDRP
jgi:hypothetical protein